MNHVGSVVFHRMHHCQGIQCGKSAAILCLARHAGLACLKFQQNTRLFVWRLVYWEVNGVKTLLCVCKVAKFARGRQPTKKGDRCAPGTRAVFASIFSCDAGIFFFMGISQLICWSISLIQT